MNIPPVYILAGGQSSRFGSDKALAVFDGQPLIVRVADAFKKIGAPVFSVAEVSGKYDALGVPTIADEKPGLGPLGGLATALRHHAGGEWIFLCSCDFMEIREEWIRRLLDERAEDCDAVLFEGAQPQPLFALYRTEILPRVCAQMESGRRSLRGLLETLRCRKIALPREWPEELAHVNSQADLERYRAWKISGASAPGRLPAIKDVL